MIRDKFENDILEEAFWFNIGPSLNFPKLDTFVNLTEENVKKIIKKTKSKSCELDPLPTVLVKFYQTHSECFT